MSRKEAPRVGLVKAAVAGTVTNAEVAAALGLTARHVQRLKERFRVEGAAGLAHRLRGRPSPQRLPADVRQRVAELLTTAYRDVNDCHAHEKLGEVQGLVLSRSSVHRLRRALGLPSKHRRRPRTYRARRARAPQMGALVQVDASPFAWLEGRGPALALHGAIDDATGTVLALHFRPTEDLHGYTTLLAQLGAAYGLPLALYGDRLNVFVRNDRHWTLAEQLAGRQAPTQFGQMLQGLGIGFIVAGSPQAKGRVERLWQTLQDRLVVELRLRGIGTPEAANAFLPTFCADFNVRFGLPPAVPQPAWRRPPLDFALHLGCRYWRTAAADNTVHLGLRWLQLPPRRPQRSWSGCRVEVRELLDGRLVALANARVIATATPPPPPAPFTLKPRKATRPPARPRPPRATPTPAAHPSPQGPPNASRPSRPKSPLAPRRRARYSAASRPSPRHPWRTPTSSRRAQG